MLYVYFNDYSVSIVKEVSAKQLIASDSVKKIFKNIDSRGFEKKYYDNRSEVAFQILMVLTNYNKFSTSIFDKPLYAASGFALLKDFMKDPEYYINRYFYDKTSVSSLKIYINKLLTPKQRKEIISNLF